MAKYHFQTLSFFLTIGWGGTLLAFSHKVKRKHKKCLQYLVKTLSLTYFCHKIKLIRGPSINRFTNWIIFVALFYFGGPFINIRVLYKYLGRIGLLGMIVNSMKLTCKLEIIDINCTMAKKQQKQLKIVKKWAKCLQSRRHPSRHCP